jgi:hypothetical protein
MTQSEAVMGRLGRLSSPTRNNFTSDFDSPMPSGLTSSLIMANRLTLTIPCPIVSLSLNWREVAASHVHFCATFVKSIDNIKCRQVTFSEI